MVSMRRQKPQYFVKHQSPFVAFMFILIVTSTLS